MYCNFLSNIYDKIKIHKKNLFYLCVKSSCFVILFYNVVLLTKDYLSFPYTFTLTYETNKVNPEIPVINICTESHVLLNSLKLSEFQGLKEEINELNCYINETTIKIKERIKNIDYLQTQEVCGNISKYFGNIIMAHLSVKETL